MPSNESGEHIRHEPYRTSHTFWSYYVSEAAQYDKHLTESWKGNMDSTLIFAGLFSAVVSAFIIESYKLLREDSGDVTTVLLTQILAVQMAALSSNSSLIPVIPSQSSATKFAPTHSAITVNILWFLSLTCSLGAALITILVQQWIRDYLRHIEQRNDPHERARIRTFLSNGIEHWRMELTVHCIPALLHISLFLFFAGLYIFLTPINTTVAHAVLPIILCSAVLYGLITAAPVIDPSCPYETSFSSLFWYLVYCIQNILYSVIRGIRRGLRWTLPSSHTMIRRFVAWYPTPRSLSSLQMARYQIAVSPQDQNSAYAMDARAFMWLHSQISGNRDLQIFLDCLPEFIGSKSDDGQKRFKLVLDNKKNHTTLRLLLERLIRLGNGGSDSFLGQQALACISALAPPLIALPPNQLKQLLPLFTTLATASISKNATLSMICFHVFTVRHNCLGFNSRVYRFYEKHPTHGRTLQFTFDVIGNMRRALEDVVGSYKEDSHHLEDILDLVQIYCATLKPKSLELHQWSDSLASVSVAARASSCLQWFHELNTAGGIQFSSDIPNVMPTIDWDTVFHGPRLLAFMRATGYLKPLPCISEISPLQTYPDQPPPVPCTTLNGDIQFHFLREIHPLLALLDLAGAKHQTRVTTVPEPGNYDEAFLLVLRVFGPSDMAQYIFDDYYRNQPVALLELVAHLRQRPDITVGDPCEITFILRRAIDELEIIKSEGSETYSNCHELLFVGVLYAILTLERKDISNGKVFVLPESEIEHLISFIQFFGVGWRESDGLSVAEQLFDAVAASEEAVIQWEDLPTRTQYIPWVQHEARWKALHDRVVEERRSFLRKMRL